MVAGFITIGCILFLNIIGIAYAFGKLVQKVSRLCNDTSHMQKNLEKMSERLNKMDIRLSVIEGRFGGRESL